VTATLEIVPSVLDRIRRTLVGLKMPRALEVLDQTVRQLERGEASALEVIDTLFAEELTLRENRRVKMALRMAKLASTSRSSPPSTGTGFWLSRSSSSSIAMR
jgi:IstB-like ATP binding protein